MTRKKSTWAWGEEPGGQTVWLLLQGVPAVKSLPRSLTLSFIHSFNTYYAAAKLLSCRLNKEDETSE